LFKQFGDVVYRLLALFMSDDFHNTVQGVTCFAE
jgi:hypothetical protein